jgi:putative ABC transport system ATP-binding protein
MVTHDPNLTKYADRIIHILDGKIQEITEIKSETTLDADVSDIKQTDENFKPEVLPAGSSG